MRGAGTHWRAQRGRAATGTLALACLASACGGDAPPSRAAADLTADSAAAPTPAPADTARPVLELAALEQLWTEQRHAEVLPLLISYRKLPYGRNELVDYMIATSACRVAGQEALGGRMFVWILDHYSIDPGSRQAVQQEMQRCPPPAQLVPATLVLAAAGPASAASTRGKMFYDLTRGADMPLANEPVRVTREVPPAELAARLFTPDAVAQAIAAVQKLAGPEYRVLNEGPFVLASSTHDEAGMRRIGEGLGHYLEFYATEYGMPRPPHLVTIYLAADGGALRRIADRVHGIAVSSQSIGYSFRDDLSMVGIIPAATYGTLAHELFHLMVRRDFGDVPPWLDEGMAALYEVSRIGPDGRIRGIPNWRGPVLRRFWNDRPSVSQLVRSDWRVFEAGEHDYEPVKQAANHATARYFVLFLQETGRLVPVYRAFHDRDALAVTGSPADDAVATLERATGESAAALDTAFATWFQGLEE